MFGRGKVILLGEHAVVYGRPALAAGIERGVRARVEPAERTVLHVEPWGREVTPEGDDELGRALAAVIAEQPGAVHAHIDAQVDLPAGAGLGCSAALGVAVVRALAAAAGEAPGDEAVAARAFAWERVFHGNPSGVDNTMAAHGGVACYRKGEPLEPVRPRRPLRLVVGDSGEPSSTRVMVEGVARQHQRDPERTEKTLDAITALVRNAKLAIEDGDLRALGQPHGSQPSAAQLLDALDHAPRGDVRGRAIRGRLRREAHRRGRRRLHDRPRRRRRGGRARARGHRGESGHRAFAAEVR
ncbi:MAG: hypothetical protein M5U28_33695 [Sandaracinaceae bacterium]|nr:hypothetical protein [Sandaracinaceae bacterium]